MESFGWALQQMRNGHAVSRLRWDDVGGETYLRVQRAQGRHQHFIYMKVSDGTLVPWNPNQQDLLAQDWQLYEGRAGDAILWGT